MMKRVLLLALVVGLVAGSASAAMFKVDVPTAMTFSFQGSSGDSFPGGPIDLDWGPVTNPDATYGTPFRYAVGFEGTLGDSTDADHTAYVLIGTTGADLLPGYDGVVMDFANDDNSEWVMNLYVTDASGTHWATPAGVAMSPLGGTLELSVATTGPVTALGFGLRGYFDGVNPPAGTPSNPDEYRISVVPIPGAFLIGLLGLGAAGIKLRRFA
jgi:hypothetical protein